MSVDMGQADRTLRQNPPSRHFDVGEVVHVENFGRGVIKEVGWVSGNVKIIFECDVNSDIDWWFSSDRVTKLREVWNEA